MTWKEWKELRGGKRSQFVLCPLCCRFDFVLSAFRNPAISNLSRCPPVQFFVLHSSLSGRTRLLGVSVEP